MTCRPVFTLLALSLGLHLSVASAQTTAAAGDKNAISDPKQVLAGIPRDVLKDLRPGSRDAEQAAIKATAQMRKNTENRTGAFKINVTVLEKFQRKEAPDVTRTRVRQTTEVIREGGASMRVFLTALIDENEKAEIEKLDKGSKITVTGAISNAEILIRKDIELHIDLMDAKIE